MKGFFTPCGTKPCDEATDRCGCNNDADCDDGTFCNGVERCVNAKCTSGSAPCSAPPGQYPVCNEGSRTCSTAMSPPQCVVDQDCSNQIFCDGAERCMPGAAGADARGCLRGTYPCMVNETCDEAGARCRNNCPDQDGDGHKDTACGGDDCDDGDANRFPGNTEVCTPGHELHDEDCDSNTVGGLDADADGHVWAGCCNYNSGTRKLTCGDDCDDGNPRVHAGLLEMCDGVDNDCNGRVDEGLLVSLSYDADGDGYGAPACRREVCPGTLKFVTNGDDCDDSKPAVKPGVQVCSSGNPTSVFICGTGGSWMAAPCGANQTCASQPNGTGDCR
jgi:putative metal-binding protein